MAVLTYNPPPSSLSSAQLSVIERPLDGKLFLYGPAGTGKTTVGVERMLYLLEQGAPGSTILVLLPQRTLSGPYMEALSLPGVVAGGSVTVVTIAGLAQRMLEKYWAQAASSAGFAWPEQPPVFLNFETAQYYLSRIVRPLFEQGFFEPLTLDHSRVYSQILDDLNQSALQGFSVDELGVRLKAAWPGDTGQARLAQDVQFCASRFREYCLAHNLLDFSLQLQTFRQFVWPMPACREELLETYRHLVADNVEEEAPVVHDFLREWLQEFQTALVIYDQDAGYRRFQGADPASGWLLKDLCQEQVLFDHSFVASLPVQALDLTLTRIISSPERALSETEQASTSLARQALVFESHRYYPQMLDWAAQQIASLVLEEGLPAGQIVVLAPYLPDSLRFALTNRLEAFAIPVRAQRPSHSLREELPTQCMLTLAALAHPQWGIQPSRFDVAHALMQAIQGLDLVRAQFLTDIVYRSRQGLPFLSSFEQIQPRAQERITYAFGNLYEGLRLWLAETIQGPEVGFDDFLSRLNEEVLSQAGYGFHANPNAAEVITNLIDSVMNFRRAAEKTLAEEGRPVGKEYLEMMQENLAAAQYLRSWQVQPDNTLLMAPAYTFLLANRPVEVQLWLDTGSYGWFDRPNQPLANPYVLSRNWPKGRVWTDEQEYQADQAAMERLALGLIRRCRSRIYLGFSELGEQGYEQRGPLLQVLKQVEREP